MELEIFLSRDCNYTKKYTKTNQVFRFFYVSSCVDVKRHESGDFWKHNLITAPLNMRRTSQETWNRWSSTAPWIDHFFFTIDMHIIDRDIWLQLACRTGVIFFPFFQASKFKRDETRGARLVPVASVSCSSLVSCLPSLTLKILEKITPVQQARSQARRAQFCWAGRCSFRSRQHYEPGWDHGRCDVQVIASLGGDFKLYVIASFILPYL